MPSWSGGQRYRRGLVQGSSCGRTRYVAAVPGHLIAAGRCGGNEMPGPDVEVAIIGGGQAGVAVAHELRRRTVDCVIFDSSPHAGHSWSNRWDSLRLFTPAGYSSLPGLPFPAPQWHYPAKDEVAHYLTDYASHFQLPLRLDSRVERICRTSETFSVSLESGEVATARHVVIATGAYGVPHIPEFATDVAESVTQIHTSDYYRPAHIVGHRVLVVGGGNSGMEIAYELAVAGYSVEVAVGGWSPSVPTRLVGRDVFWWFERSRFVSAPCGSVVGRALRSLDGLVIGTSRRLLRHLGVTFRKRVVSASCDSVEFTNGRAPNPDTIIWATGFRQDDGWIDIPGALDAAGHPRRIRRNGSWTSCHRSVLAAHPRFVTPGLCRT
jgi:putative flavoprotein involved in K+ transport